MTRPFSNGSDAETWMDKWCAYCTYDHSIHADTGSGCDLIVEAMVMGDDWVRPEVWLPAPDDGAHVSPSRMICTMFAPCEPCGGDPGAGARAERMTEVQAYWRDRPC